MLTKHHTSFLQMPQTNLQNVAATLQREMQKHSNLLTSSQCRTAAAFLQVPGDYFGAAHDNVLHGAVPMAVQIGHL